VNVEVIKLIFICNFISMGVFAIIAANGNCSLIAFVPEANRKHLRHMGVTAQKNLKNFSIFGDTGKIISQSEIVSGISSHLSLR